MNNETNLRILIVDDNPEIHKDFIKILTRDLSLRPEQPDLQELEKKLFGEDIQRPQLSYFHIDSASQGEEGIELVKKSLKENNPYALAFVDIRMPPGLNGIETIKKVWSLDPDIQVVICTAFSDYSWEETVNELGQKENLLILKKPFDNIAVRQLACALTRKWELLQDSRRYTLLLQEQVQDRTASLQESLSLVKATLESSNDGIVVISNEGKIMDYNQKFVNMWEIPHDILEKHEAIPLHTYMLEQLTIPHIIFSQEETEKINILFLKNGKIFEYYSQPQKIEEKIVGQVLDFRNITKRIKLEKKLEHQATHDSLTGLPNRVILLDRIREAIEKSKTMQTSFGILFLDLDRFKLINDSLSHAVGDKVLKITARRLQKLIRTEDTLARLGGDEFIILFNNILKEADIITKTRRIQSAFDAPFSISERHVIVTASIGISLYPKDGETPDILLRNADAAMYTAKELRGNSFQFYTPELNNKNLEKLDKEMQLRQALIHNEFFLCYQPQIDLKMGKIVAAEALLRWKHPQKGILLPIDFIPLAEETGLISSIGEWVLRTACKQNVAWQEAGFPPIRVAVNVTAQQFVHYNIVSLVSDIIKETKIKPEYLELELTENVIISHPDIIKAVEELKKLGITIAIDDFGTGYSSLSYLKKIPLDRLKIDSSFIRHIKTANDDEVIIRAVIAMAKNLNLEVLAEGVETQNQVDFLKLHDCGDVQGFYFSKPLTIKEIEQFLEDPEKITALMIEPSD